MALKDVIKHEEPPSIEVVWADGSGAEVLRHGYPNSMMRELRAAIGPSAAESYAALIEAVEATCTPSTASEVRSRLVEALNAEYERRMHVIAGGYPLSERESWHVQTAEARALIADVHAFTPWINGAAAARQIDRLVLAQRIAAKDDQYRAIHGALTGARQRIEDQIDAAGEDAQALQLIDVLAGWPGQEENQ
ncbi:hypothetical protein ACN9MJ_10650 [Acidovorax facilis]|uniref:hypothetical protein n=1 Tax=Acidovorax facilis TaxID=12917 RepID=UPI003CF540F9